MSIHTQISQEDQDQYVHLKKISWIQNAKDFKSEDF